MKKKQYGVLAVLCLFALIVSLAVGEETAQPIALNVETEANILSGGDSLYFSFTSPETRYYMFSSHGTIDLNGYLYDSDMNMLAYGNMLYSDYTNNFYITFELKEGKSYYFKAVPYFSSITGSFSVLLTTFDGLYGLDSTFESKYVEYGDSVDLAVNANAASNAQLSYEWYYSNPGSDWIKMENYTGQYHVGEVTSRIQYRCIVTDNYGTSITKIFNLYVDNCLIANVAGTNSSSKSIEVMPNTSTELEVSASAINDDLTYTWYKNWDMIEGATGSSISTGPVTEQITYHCEITDQYNNKAYVYFYLSIDNALKARVAGTDSTNIKLTVVPENRLSLSVAASCRYGTLQYLWYDNNWNEIEGETGSSIITEPITSYTRYQCKVTDEYNNCEYIYYTIVIDNALTATVAGTDKDNKAQIVYSGDTPTLVIAASCMTGSIDYQWYKNENIIEGATGSEYTADPITEFTSYTCTVSDQYESSVDVEYSFYVYNNLSGQCGDDVYWSLDDNGHMTVSGQGRMWDYNYDEEKIWERYVSSLTIEEGITYIGEYAFAYCENLGSVSIADSVSYIGGWAFTECIRIENVVIPEQMTEIRKGTFYKCTGLSSVQFPSHLGSIKEMAFAFCSSLSSVTIPVNTVLGTDAFPEETVVQYKSNVPEPASFASWFLSALQSWEDGVFYTPTSGFETYNYSIYIDMGEEIISASVTWLSGSTNFKNLFEVKNGYLSVTGDISGTGTATFQLTGTTASGTATKDFTVTVSDMPQSISSLQQVEQIALPFGESIFLPGTNIIPYPAICGVNLDFDFTNFNIIKDEGGRKTVVLEPGGYDVYGNGTGTIHVSGVICPCYNLGKRVSVDVVVSAAFELPDSLETIETGAFSGVPIERVLMPDGATYAEDAFDPGVTIYHYHPADSEED